VDQHADARRVDIWVRRAGEGVRLVIRDDGNGFSVPPDLSVLRAGNHFGVIGMAERARTIGADFIVRSAPSEGTLIEVLAPLSQPAPDSRP
jgi:signal transduction histidine kinase